MQEEKLKLDELEIAIQLVQLNDPELKKATYKNLANEIEKQFNCKVDYEDIFLLYEPTIEQEEEDIRIHYHAMFNI